MVLIDKQELFRSGMRATVNSIPGTVIVGEGGNISEVPKLVKRHQASLAVIGVEQLDPTVLKVCAGIAKSMPQTKILLLLSKVDDRALFKLNRSWIHGLGWKSVKTANLIRGIIRLVNNKLWQDRGMNGLRGSRARRFRENFVPGNVLSPRERQTLELVSQGYTNKQIGKTLSLTEKTIKNYLANVFQKLHVKRRAEAAAMYVQYFSDNPELPEAG